VHGGFDYICTLVIELGAGFPLRLKRRIACDDVIQGTSPLRSLAELAVILCGFFFSFHISFSKFNENVNRDIISKEVKWGQ